MATNLLSLFGHIQQQGELGRAQGQRSRLADLAGQAYAAPAQQRSGIVQQAIATDPQAGFALNQQLQGDDDARMQRVGQMAGMLISAPPEARAQLWSSQIVPEMQRIGFGEGLSPQWSEEYLPMAQQIAQQLGGGSGSNVQSTFIDAQGNRVAIMRDGSTQVLGRNAPNNQIIDTGNGFFGVNKGNLQAAPVMVGGQGGIQYATSDGQPISENEMPALRAAIAADARGESFNIPTGGQQLRSAPDQISPAEQARLDMEAERLRLAQEAAQRAAEASQAAQAVKDQVAAAKAQKARVAAQDSVDAYTDAIETIDGMRSHPGYSSLGTAMGDVATNVPVIRTDAKGANASLETLKSQIMINTLSKLKALSATGAAGFGALNQSEGDALRRAIANLDTAQSHEDLDRAVLRVRQVMERSAQRIAEAAGGLGNQQQSAPQAGGFRILD